MEGISGRHEPSAFTSRRSRRPWRLLHAPKRRRRPAHSGRKRGRRQRCQRLDRSRAPWEENAHARRFGRPTTCRARKPNVTRKPKRVSSTIRRSVSDAVKVSGSPVKSFGAQSPRDVHAAKAAAAQPGTYEVRVHAVRLGGRSRSDASRVLSAGRSQGLVAKQHDRALAGRKLEASGSS